MSEGILSQAEIDALLKGTDDADTDFIPDDITGDELTEIEKDAVGEVSNITLGTASTTLSTLLGKKVSITVPSVTIISVKDFEMEYGYPHTIVDVKYTEGLTGSNVLILKNTDAAVIADLMMGGEGHVDISELNEMHLSAVSEAMNQMMGSASTSMSQLINRTINIAPPQVEIVNIAEDGIKFLDPELNKIVLIKFNMEIEGLINSQLVQIIPVDFAKEMAVSLIGSIGSAPEPEQQSYNEEREFYQQSAAPVQENAFTYQEPAANHMSQAPQQGFNYSQPAPGPSINVSPAEFRQLEYNLTDGNSHNLDLILDVALNVSVELGRTKKTVKEILDFSTGSIIELNKLAGEAVDLMINGKLFAKGEVVVIDENFGVRILDIVSPIERVKKLQ